MKKKRRENEGWTSNLEDSHRVITPPNHVGTGGGGGASHLGNRNPRTIRVVLRKGPLGCLMIVRKVAILNPSARKVEKAKARFPEKI